MKINNIHTIIKLLKKETKKFVLPSVTTIANKNKDPFLVLISCLLSLRTKDIITSRASERLFKLAKTPLETSKLSTKIIEKTIFPVGFYKTKAKRIVEISKILLKNYNGKVPNTIEELLKLNGVGRKTANLVVILGYNKYGICVDTHVHRISNRLGFVKTKTPEKTEFELRKKLPKKYWKIYNDLLVTYGQNICKPISPFCSKCIINKYCDKVDVTKSR
jgi:endonuclease-3